MPQWRQHVTAALQESGMPPRKLQLEITETVLLQLRLATKNTLHPPPPPHKHTPHLTSPHRSFIQDLSNGAEPLAIVNAVAGSPNASI